jgi:thioredoxin reductase
MSSQVDVAIIGAGPYGLSLAAHLRAMGVEHRVFGSPMDAWENHMPRGMFLKSYGDSSNLFDPQSSFTLEDFSREKEFSYHPSRLPVKLETFVAYGRAFQERFVPHVEAKRLIMLNISDRGHALSFENAETVIAKHVVLAIGVVPFKFVPSGLSNMPAALVSHSSDFGPLDNFSGQEVIVIGSGASALDLAALLSERNAKVTIISRSPQVHFQSPPKAEDRLLRRIYSPPASGLGGGWLLRICGDAPHLIHLLPDRLRLAILSNTLGPSGGYFIRHQVEGKVPLKLGRSIERADEYGGRIRLRVLGLDGTCETIESDHVVAATGYRVDLQRLGFLSQQYVEQLRMVEQTPILTADFESSVPGLYFVGLAAARSFGPVMRFVVGAIHPSRRLSAVLPRSLLRRPISRSAARPN